MDGPGSRLKARKCDLGGFKIFIVFTRYKVIVTPQIKVFLTFPFVHNFTKYVTK